MTTSLARIGWLERTARERYADLQRLVVVESKNSLFDQLREARQLAQRWKVA